ncbi:ribosome-releasing factor 2, mitochondrial [Culicoides brevitarsis]|uniref:ribosome-releasing factor 2, mitochondrial n=1 Tax=Culicoides brevitarsis TaxID=469753 RepID=UPI00307BA61D
MLKLRQIRRLKLAKIGHNVRFCSTNAQRHIRNIGILAHIDAGKTTTTERMLFYAGKTRALGEVHHGNTVTDFLQQERERGITICSSAVSFNWKEHRINLLDTPGHIDFTMEVEQSLSAVDGTVVILDASAGVEAQTTTVWGQTERHALPRLVFVNKMDRGDADFVACLNDLRKKLGANPVALQYPIHDKSGFTGMIDLVQQKQLTFDKTNQGRSYRIQPVESKYEDILKKHRNELIDALSGVDDALAEVIIANDSLESVELQIVLEAIRRSCIERKIIPVLLGSAYKNTGVQPLLDAVLNYLPAPFERNKIYDCFGNDFVGKVFKVMHDKQRGPLSLVRVHRGVLKKNSRVTTSKGGAEQITRIYDPLADEYVETNQIGEGDIGVCSGLKHTVTGDILVSSMSSLKSAQKRLMESLKKETPNPDDEQDEDVEILKSALSLEPKIPDAVYFCSIEPPSQAYQQSLDTALKQIQREDPSLRVHYDENTAQTVLGGMGELHLDIIKSRLLTEYKIEADLGPLQIAYKETINAPMRETVVLAKEIAGTKQNVTIELTVQNIKESKHPEIFRLDTSKEAAEALSAVRPRILKLVRKGALAALSRGPRLGCPVIDAQIILHAITTGRGTADSFIMAAAGQCVHKILQNSDSGLLEPIMELQIIAPQERISVILGDLGRRRAIINDVRPKGEQNKVIEALAPLSELTGYSSTIRTISSGTASLILTPHSYASMTLQDETRAIQKAQGLL